MSVQKLILNRYRSQGLNSERYSNNNEKFEHVPLRLHCALRKENILYRRLNLRIDKVNWVATGTRLAPHVQLDRNYYP